MCCVKYLTMAFPLGLLAKIDNPVPASQVRFQQFRVVEQSFCVKDSNKRSDRGHSSNDLQLFIGRAFRASTSSFSAKLKLNSAFPFFLVTAGEGTSQGD